MSPSKHILSYNPLYRKSVVMQSPTVASKPSCSLHAITTHIYNESNMHIKEFVNMT